MSIVYYIVWSLSTGKMRVRLKSKANHTYLGKVERLGAPAARRSVAIARDRLAFFGKFLFFLVWGYRQRFLTSVLGRPFPRRAAQPFFSGRASRFQPPRV